LSEFALFVLIAQLNRLSSNLLPREGRPMELRTIFVAILALVVAATETQAQQATPGENDSSFTSRTTNVLVPALVCDAKGKVVYTLQAENFVLTDDGVPQKLTLQHETGGEPLALVIAIEVGAAGMRRFQKDERLVPPLAPMLPSIVGKVSHRVAVVTFDSRPKIVRGFTSDLDEVEATLRGLSTGNQFDTGSESEPANHKPSGDNGAAILDTLAMAVNLLQAEPAGYRRAILLFSETADRGSEISMEQAVRAMTETNTAIYAIGFSTAKSEAVHYAYRQLPLRNHPPRGSEEVEFEDTSPNPQHGCMGKDPDPDPDAPASRWSQFYDCAAQLVPPLTFAKLATIATADSLLKNVPATVARLTGGEYFKLGSERNLEHDLTAIGNHLPNRYILSFHP